MAARPGSREYDRITRPPCFGCAPRADVALPYRTPRRPRLAAIGRAAVAAPSETSSVFLSPGSTPPILALWSYRSNRARQWTAIGCHATQQPGNPLLARRLALTGEFEWARLRPAPYRPARARLLTRLGPLVDPDAGPGRRQEALDRLAGFAGPSNRSTCPQAMTRPKVTASTACTTIRPPGRWPRSASKVGGAPRRMITPAGGAAATVTGMECNRRYRGSCPDRLAEIDERLAPPGGGYLFAEDDIHQACDTAGSLTISLHLLAAGGPEAQQRCHKLPRHPARRTDSATEGGRSRRTGG